MRELCDHSGGNIEKQVDAMRLVQIRDDET